MFHFVKIYNTATKKNRYALAFSAYCSREFFVNKNQLFNDLNMFEDLDIFLLTERFKRSDSKNGERL